VCALAHFLCNGSCAFGFDDTNCESSEPGDVFRHQLIVKFTQESAHMFVLKPASIQFFAFKVSKNSTVIGDFDPRFSFCTSQALTLAYK